MIQNFLPKSIKRCTCIEKTCFMYIVTIFYFLNRFQADGHQSALNSVFVQVTTFDPHRKETCFTAMQAKLK